MARAKRIVEPAAADVADRAHGVALPRELLEASPNPIVAVDERGLIRYANPQAQSSFGYAAD